MSNHTGNDHDLRDSAPGDESSEGGSGVAKGVRGYVVGLVLASGLTVASFVIATTQLLWMPGIAVMLVVLAFAQIGVHLAFFLHITTGPDNTNNIMALAFGGLIVFLVIAGSLWIMAHLNHNMLPMQEMMNRQR